jgi:signal transduction histidine kinase
MNLKFTGSHHSNRFSRLGLLYVLALGVIACTLLAGQVLIQSHLRLQRSDSHVINVAGRQRMLSQRICKDALLLSTTRDETERNAILADLRSALDTFKQSQDGLLEGSESLGLPPTESDTIRSMYRDVAGSFNAIYENGSALARLLEQDPGTSHDSLRVIVDAMLSGETAFVQGMDRIVMTYDAEALAKVRKLSQMEYILLFIALAVIALEVILIFRPTAKQVNRTIHQLINSEQNARQLTKEIGALYGSLEKSYEQLSQVNEPVENPKLYAKADRGGNVSFISEMFSEMSGINSVKAGMRLCDLFPGSGLDDDWMDHVVEQVSEGRNIQTEITFEGAGNSETAVVVTIVPIYGNGNEVEELFVMGSDITRQKNAERTMRQKNRAEVEKKINQQKFRSVLILEGQEEERKRIAMDIHDGIGQMLTSLKFQIESMDSGPGEKNARKLAEIKQGIKDVIKEVRRVTFNLKPTVLGDYGLQAALNVFIQEIGKLTDTTLEFRTEGSMTYRLPQKVENNIFRIVQEAINNAIKYSGAPKIDVLLKQDENDLVITVSDKGRGFDEKIVEARDVNIDSGRGFFNMYERTEYINGNLEIKSAPGEGTTVRLTVPLRNSAAVEA